MNNIPYIAAALAVGVCISSQPPINATMARTLGSPLMAASISIAITLVITLIIWLSITRGNGDIMQIRSLPWWVILGGVAGVVFVVGGVVVAPVIGIALFFSCVVAGQLLGSGIADHIGAFGLPVKPLNSIKLLGLMMVLAGAILVQSGNA